MRSSLAMSMLGEVEEAGVVERLGRGRADCEVEELHLGRGVEGEALLAGPVEVALAARSGGRPRTARRREVLDVAEHAGDRVRRRRATGAISKVLGSGRASMSDSWTRLKPSMAEPSKVMPSSRAVSSSAGVIAKRFSVPEHVGEPEADEADAALLDGPQDVVELAAASSSLRTVA